MAAVQLLQPGNKLMTIACAGVAASRSTTVAAAAAPLRAAGLNATTCASSALVDTNSMHDPASIILTGCSYRELIAITRQRDTMRRQLHQQAAEAATAEQQQQQQASDEPRQLPGPPGVEAAGMWQVQQLEDEDNISRDEGLPLRRHDGDRQHHRKSRANDQQQQQQDQDLPNSRGDSGAVPSAAGGTGSAVRPPVAVAALAIAEYCKRA